MVPEWSEGRVSWLGLMYTSFLTVPQPLEIMQYLKISKANLGIQSKALKKQTVLWTFNTGKN